MQHIAFGMIWKSEQCVFGFLFSELSNLFTVVGRIVMAVIKCATTQCHYIHSVLLAKSVRILCNLCYWFSTWSIIIRYMEVIHSSITNFDGTRILRRAHLVNFTFDMRGSNRFLPLKWKFHMETFELCVVSHASVCWCVGWVHDKFWHHVAHKMHFR